MTGAHFTHSGDDTDPLNNRRYAGDLPAWLILATASRPFFLAALRELRLDSAAAVSGWGGQGPAAPVARNFWRFGEFLCE